MVLPLLILIGLLIVAYAVYAAVIYWYISLPVIGFIVFCLKADSIGKWSAQRRAQKQRRIEEEKRKLQLELEEFRRTEFIRLDRIEQEQKEKKFWDDIRKKLEDQKIVQPSLPDYTIRHKPKPCVTKRKRPSTLQEAMSAFQRKTEQKSNIDLKKCYKILGLKMNASSVLQIQMRFKELAIKYHPDRNINSKSAVKKFAEIVDARKRILETIQVAI
jgi:hypothetical protein